MNRNGRLMKRNAYPNAPKKIPGKTPARIGKKVVLLLGTIGKNRCVLRMNLGTSLIGGLSFLTFRNVKSLSIRMNNNVRRPLTWKSGRKKLVRLQMRNRKRYRTIGLVNYLGPRWNNRKVHRKDPEKRKCRYKMQAAQNALLVTRRYVVILGKLNQVRPLNKLRCWSNMR